MSGTRLGRRHTFFISVLMCAIASTPLSLGAVAAHWAGLGADLLPWSKPETAVDLVRTFVVAFDVLVLTAWGPCAIAISRVRW
jgi:hypothetical protein